MDPEAFFFFFLFNTWTLVCIQLAGQSYNLSLKGSPYWMAPEVLHIAIPWTWVCIQLVPFPSFLDSDYCCAGHASCVAKWCQSWTCSGRWYMEFGLYHHWNAEWKTSLEWFYRGEDMIKLVTLYSSLSRLVNVVYMPLFHVLSIYSTYLIFYGFTKQSRLCWEISCG